MGATVECNMDAIPALDETLVSLFIWLKAIALCMWVSLGLCVTCLVKLTVKTVEWLRPPNLTEHSRLYWVVCHNDRALVAQTAA